MRSLGMLSVAAVGLVVNLVAMRVPMSGRGTNVNMRGSYLEVWSDMLGSIGVLGAAAVLWLTGWTWVDTLVAVGIGLWALPRAWSLLKETINVLLEGVPRGLDLQSISFEIRGIPGVANLHDLHVWALTSDQASLSAHVVLASGCDDEVVRSTIVTQATLQTERVDCRTLGCSAPTLNHWLS